MVEDTKGKRYKLKLPPVTFLVCLLIAGLGWAIVNFSREYTVTLSYKVVCTDLPKNIDSVLLSDSIVNLTFNTKGLNYLNPKFSEENRLLFVSVKSLIHNKSKRSSYTIKKKALNEYIKEKAIFEHDFVEVNDPDELTFYLK